MESKQPIEVNPIIDFKSFIQKILKDYAELSDNNVQLLTSEDIFHTYVKAFTSKNIDPINNYEVLEFLGDGVVNCIAVWYENRKFPSIKDEKTLTRLKHYYVSKKVLGDIALKLGFWDYIKTKIKNFISYDILSDVFEAFIGALLEITDKKNYIHTGYGLCYSIVSKLFDTIEIDFERLSNPKSDLLEFYQKVKKYGLQSKFIVEEKMTDSGKLYIVEVKGDVMIGDKITKNVKLGEGRDYKKAIAEKNASEKALSYLKKYMKDYF